LWIESRGFFGSTSKFIDASSNVMVRLRL